MAARGRRRTARPARRRRRFDFDRTPGRLSKQVVPSHYALTLDLDPARDTFHGEVVVTLQVREPVAAIELHAEKLEAERLALEIPGALPRALREQRLRIAYRGVIGRSGTGLFHGSAPSATGTEAMLATQLASIHARELLPVFDEP